MAFGYFAAADPCMCEWPFRLKHVGWRQSVSERTREEECVENMFPPEAKDLWMLLCVFCTLQGCSFTVMDKTDVWHTSTSSWVCCSQKGFFLQRLQLGAGLSGAARGRTEVEVIVKHEAWDKSLFSHVCHSWAQIPTHTHTPHGKVIFYVFQCFSFSD